MIIFSYVLVYLCSDELLSTHSSFTLKILFRLLLDHFSGHGGDLEWKSSEEIVEFILGLEVVDLGCFDTFCKEPDAKIEICLFKFKTLMQDMLA